MLKEKKIYETIRAAFPSPAFSLFINWSLLHCVKQTSLNWMLLWFYSLEEATIWRTLKENKKNPPTPAQRVEQNQCSMELKEITRDKTSTWLKLASWQSQGWVQEPGEGRGIPPLWRWTDDDRHRHEFWLATFCQNNDSTITKRKKEFQTIFRRKQGVAYLFKHVS